jgi:hypothetical protein
MANYIDNAGLAVKARVCRKPSSGPTTPKRQSFIINT